MEPSFQDKLEAIKSLLNDTLGPDAHLLLGDLSKQASDTVTNINDDMTVVDATEDDNLIVISSDVDPSILPIGNLATRDGDISLNSDEHAANNTKFTLSDIHAIKDLDLTILLAKHNKFGSIEKGDRVVVAKCIVKNLLTNNHDLRIDRQCFLDIAAAITEAFPSEQTASYFIPSHGSVSAKGALYNSYRSYRESLGNVALISVRAKARKTTKVTGENEAEDEEDPVKSLAFVKSNTDPKPGMEHHWEISRAERLKLLKTMTNFVYFDTFPVLKMGDGFHWLMRDFDSKYPESADISILWPDVASKIIAFARAIRNKNPVLKQLLNDINESNENVVSILLLPLILKNVTTTNKQNKDGKKTARLTKVEISSMFVQQFKTEAERVPDDVTHDYPRMTLIGTDLNNAILYVEVGEVRYGFQNPLICLGTCFKLYFALDCEFHPSSKHIWQFIDAAIYRLNVINVMPSVKSQLFDILKM
ncbi:uncharacterized protein LOC119085518 [Bradysia coprophila]|uniref:uncharacterized protein LOC119085518 n=1 Tax=Bradysia coprophila TaxID=38358 RepID=UPI00187DB994|nr:uncharacterized protein LOC119085518 [Bradysia coprophila]